MVGVVIENPGTALKRWRRESFILPEKVTESLAETALEVADGQWNKFPSEETKNSVFREREDSLKQRHDNVQIQDIEELIIYAQK